MADQPHRNCKYKPEYAQRARELHARGCSRVDLARDLGVVYWTLLNWQKTQDDFAEALKLYSSATGYPAKYHPDLCQVVIELGLKGYSKTMLAREIGVNRDTLRDWKKKHPEFAEALTYFKDWSQAWWEEQGQNGLWEKTFNANAFVKQMSSRFPDEWRNRQETQLTGKGGGPLGFIVVPEKDRDDG